MTSTTQHWGEVETVKNDQQNIGDVTTEIEKSMNKFCLAEFDTESDELQKIDQLTLKPMDPLILHAISMHKYNNNLLDKISVIEDVNCKTLPLMEDVTPLPDLIMYKRKHIRNSLNYIEKNLTVPNEDIQFPEISDAIAKQILMKVTAIMFAHIGYETTNQSVLDFMTDVLEDIIKKICYKLKLAHEDEVNVQSTGFPNVIERVFVDIGLGGIRGLHDYYENRVVKYVNVLHRRSVELKCQYEKLLEPKVTKQSNKINKVIRINIKREDDNEENPEIHFENADLGSSFETGFELLNSLEAGTNLEEEDINVTASTSASVSALLPEVEISSSPLNKKKRTK